MERKVKAIVHDFDILFSREGTGKIILYLKHPEEDKITDYPLAHLMVVNKILNDAKLMSLKQLVGKLVELTIASKEEIVWKSMA